MANHDKVQQLQFKYLLILLNVFQNSSVYPLKVAKK